MKTNFQNLKLFSHRKHSGKHFPQTSLLPPLYPFVWLRVGWVGVAPTQVLGMTPTLLMFGWLYWDGLAPTLNLCLVGGIGI